MGGIMPFRGLLAQCPAVPDVNQRGDAMREDRVFRPCHFSAASYRYESHAATVPPQGEATISTKRKADARWVDAGIGA